MATAKAKRKLMTDDDVKSFGKGKKEKKQGLDSLPHNRVHNSTVKTASLRATLNETFVRTMDEIYGELFFKGTSTDKGRMEAEEMGYIMMLSMLTGNPEINPRKGVKIREHTYRDVPLCRECA